MFRQSTSRTLNILAQTFRLFQARRQHMSMIPDALSAVPPAYSISDPDGCHLAVMCEVLKYLVRIFHLNSLQMLELLNK